MTDEIPKRDNKTAKQIKELTQRVEALENTLTQGGHIMGWPRDLLEAHGLKVFDKKVDTLKVKRVGAA